MSDYGPAVNQAMSKCPGCSRLSDSQKLSHYKQALRDIERTQARTLEPLPSYVWAEGCAPTIDQKVIRSR